VERGSTQAYGALVEPEVMTPLRDGVQLATTIFRPALNGQAAPGRFPAILERTPYDRRLLYFHLTGQFFARHGYVVAFQDVRGRGDSGGEFHYLFEPATEAEDGYDTVEWLASLDGCDGQVGTIGISYTAAVQQALAVLKPPHLRTQFIVDTGWNYFARMTRQGGAFTPGLVVPYVLRLAANGRQGRADAQIRAALASAFSQTADWLRTYPPRRGATPLRLTPEYEDWLFDVMTRGTYEAYWRTPAGSLQEFVDDYPDIPLYLLSSWYGHHPWANCLKYAELRRRLTSPVVLQIGVWEHRGLVDMIASTWAGEVDFGLEAAFTELNSLRLKWFDHWLKGCPTDILDQPPVRYFVMGGGSGRRNAEGRMQHGGSWRLSSEWPPRSTRPCAYYLTAEGGLASEPGRDGPPSTYVYNPADPVPTLGGNFSDPRVPGLFNCGAWDQRGRTDLVFCRDALPLAQRSDVLVFQTPPLDADVEVTGPVVANLWVASSARDTDFTVKLIDVHPPNPDYPDGFCMNLVDSVLRMRFRNGFEHEEFMLPGEVYPISIEVGPTSNRFGRGHRLRVDVSSSSFPQFDANTNTAEPLGQERGKQVAWQSVYHDRLRPSHVLVSVVT
jgi:uncharacterized protein